MKYILKKKWHQCQVEEVGHVFEEDTQHNLEYVYNIEDIQRNKYISGECLQPHEIALLCDAGYLVKEYDIPLDLWTEWKDIPTCAKYWVIKVIADKLVIEERENYLTDMDIYYFETKNCHKTKKSAEEALKRLLEQE